MARAEKPAGSGSKARRAARRTAKFNPKPSSAGGGGAALVNVGDASQYDEEHAAANEAGKKNRAQVGKKLGKRKKGESGDDDGASGAKERSGKKSHKKVDSSSKSHATTTTTEKVDFSKLSRKEAKVKSDEMKALRKPNFALIQELAQLWERMRAKKVSKTDRKALCDNIYSKCIGKIPELANNHKGSRVVQAVLKYGTPEQCESIMKEVHPQIALLSKSLYGNFLVRKLIDSTDKKDVPALVKTLKGQIARLARHPIGAQIVEALYHAAPAKEKKAMTFEFFGPEFVHFGAADDVNSLREALLLKPVAQRQGTLRHINMTMIPVLEKGLVSSTVIHRVLAEYLGVGGPSTKAEAAGSIAAAALLRMMHTKEGAQAVNMMLAHSGAKQRKGVIKALKGQIARVSQDDYAHVVIASLFDCVDDTQLLSKGVVNELKQEGLEEISMHKNARRVLLHILHPRSTRYFPPHLLECLPDPEVVRREAADSVQAMKRGGEAEKQAKKAVGKEISDDEDDEDDDMGVMDDEFGGEEDKASDDDDDDEDDDDIEEAPADGPDFGIAKKPTNARREEIFRQGLGSSLIATCSSNAASMLRHNLASDVLFEVASGGSDDVFVNAVGDDAMKELYEAISQAVADSLTSEEVDGETGEKLEPLHSNFFSTRTLRRMALEVGHAAFIPAFWSLALKDNLKLWIDGHGAKVVAAVVRADTDAKTKKAIHAAVGKLVEGGDAMAWSDGFFRAREGEANKTPSSKGKRSEPSGKSATKGKKTKATPKK
jgi:pumilio family protein 6